jgi:hypothetical protein
MASIVVAGALANKCLNGGEAWVRLSWVEGLRKLGFDVWFIEQIRTPSTAQAAFFDRVVAEFGLADRAVLVDESEPVSSELLDVAAEAELLVNISGNLSVEPLFGRFKRKAFVDLDPGFTQCWHAAGEAGARLDGHDHYFTIGENIGRPDCPIPTNGIRWLPTRQPVVLDRWPVSNGTPTDRFTTVANWRGPYGRIEHDGRTYGLKLDEFRKFIELPSRASCTFELALNIHPEETGDLELLERNGWQLADPVAAAADPASFRDYVQASGAEFSVAQGIYVETRNGWFSDRTVRYLASGKPALVQDTGFGDHYPVGEGLLTFRTMNEAVAGSEQIVEHHDRHARSARAVAEAYFDSDKVLGRLVEDVGVAH